MKVLLLIASALPFITGQNIPGGWRVLNATLTDPNVVFAVNAINVFYNRSGDKRPRVGERVISAISQVVAGVKYSFQIVVTGGDAAEQCSVVVWSRPWLNGSDALLIQGQPNCVPEVLLLVASALPFITGQYIPGGWRVLNATLTDPNVIFAVNAINVFYNRSGDKRPRVGERVISAISQVVAGVKYSFQIVVTGGDAAELCSVVVWSRPWLTGSDALLIQGQPNCVPAVIGAAPPVGVVGGQQDVSFFDSDVQKAVQFLESKLNAKSNSLFYLKATAASKVTKQVVNGVIYRFYDITYVESLCTQNDVKQDANRSCAVNANSPVIEICSDEVYYNPREATPYAINSESCSLSVKQS